MVWGAGPGYLCYKHCAWFNIAKAPRYIQLLLTLLTSWDSLPRSETYMAPIVMRPVCFLGELPLQQIVEPAAQSFWNHQPIKNPDSLPRRQNFLNIALKGQARDVGRERQPGSRCPNQ